MFISLLLGGFGPKKKKIQSELVSSQIWCYLILGGSVDSWVGGCKKKVLGLNLYQAKSAVISFRVGGWVVPRRNFGSEHVTSQIWCYLILGGRLVPRTFFQSEFVTSQIWCYLILGGWLVPRTFFQSEFVSSQILHYIISGGERGGGGL